SRHRDFEGEENYESLYMHLNDKSMSNSIDSDSVSSVTLFSGAGIFSWMSFWGLNPLMKGGKQKTLQKKDIPKLHEADRAESCYFRFQEQLNKQKMKEQLAQQPSLLQTIIMCHWKEIVISGFFSLLKIIESLSQRQWYFRTRLIGLKVRSLLIAAIYQKQLGLSNAARLMHSGGAGVAGAALAFTLRK
ncbi:hypothetical protein S83_063340, partial [Arachis hypogaea]